MIKGTSFFNAILLGLLLSCVAISCKPAENKDEQKDGQKAASSSTLQIVEVVKPMAREFSAQVQITGTAKPFQKVMVHAMESGVVVKMNKDIGDQVRQGEVIAQLENPQLKRDKEKLQARMQMKKAVYDRLQATHEKTPSITPLQILEEAESEFKTAEAELNAVLDRIGLLSVKAPFSGVVSQRFADKGSLIQSGLNQSKSQALVEIQQLDPIRLTVHLPEADATTISKGMEANFYFPELPGKAYTGKVSRTSKVLDASSKTMQVELDVPNPKGTILSGMYAKVNFSMKSRSDVISLPAIAKFNYQDESHILIVKDGSVQRIKLRSGLADKDYFEVLNSEINAESEVIVSGKSLVVPGQKVKTAIKAN